MRELPEKLPEELPLAALSLEELPSGEVRAGGAALLESVTPTSSEMETINEMILEPYFDSRTSKFMDDLINIWSVQDPGNPKGLEQALDILHHAINFDHATFKIFLATKFGTSPQEELKASRDHLELLSTHCNGGIKETSLIWKSCRDISSFSDEELKSKIGDYFKLKSNKFLQEKHERIYGEIQKQHSPAAADQETYLQ